MKKDSKITHLVAVMSLLVIVLAVSSCKSKEKIVSQTDVTSVTKEQKERQVPVYVEGQKITVRAKVQMNTDNKLELTNMKANSTPATARTDTSTGKRDKKGPREEASKPPTKEPTVVASIDEEGNLKLEITTPADTTDTTVYDTNTTTTKTKDIVKEKPRTLEDFLAWIGSTAVMAVVIAIFVAYNKRK